MKTKQRAKKAAEEKIQEANRMSETNEIIIYNNIKKKILSAQRRK